MVTITLKGREIPLIYTTWEMKQVQEEIGPIARAMSMVLGRNPDDENDRSHYAGAEHLDALAKLIRILGNAGLEEAGEAGDLTDKKVLRAIKPVELADVTNKCMDALKEGMARETSSKKEEGPVDVTLEEMEKKKETES